MQAGHLRHRDFKIGFLYLGIEFVLLSTAVSRVHVRVRCNADLR